LFNFYNDITTIIEEIRNYSSKKNKIPHILSLSSKIGLMIHWLFDIVVTLANKLLSVNRKTYFSWGPKLLLECLSLGLFKDCYDITLMTNTDINQILKIILNITTKLGDIISVANAAKLPQTLYGKGFNDFTTSSSGLLSGLIGLGQFYFK